MATRRVSEDQRIQRSLVLSLSITLQVAGAFLGRAIPDPSEPTRVPASSQTDAHTLTIARLVTNRLGLAAVKNAPSPPMPGGTA